jgi:predicted PhzF superfamily epimerase YddE/YHI9
MSFERQVRGNPCTVSLAVAPPDAPPEDPIHIPCASWRIADDRAGVRCWALNGQAITLCGHGLLCTGAAWMRSHAAVSELEMNGLTVAFYAEDDLAWIGLPPIDCSAVPVPAWVRDFFPAPPWRAAIAGDDNGYLILEWPAGFDLASLPVPDYGLRRRTSRSLIVSCIDQSDPTIDIQLRYFAPQHGVPEDTATGSAMRVLATYWRNRELDDGLRAYQCSPYGGILRSRIRGELTWVGGRIVCTSGGEWHDA